jgi:hypothetical protein
MNWKECGRKRSGGNFKVQAMNLPGGTEESHEDPQDNRSAGRDVKLEPPEYEAEMLTTQPRRSVWDGRNSSVI